MLPTNGCQRPPACLPPHRHHGKHPHQRLRPGYGREAAVACSIAAECRATSHQGLQFAMLPSLARAMWGQYTRRPNCKVQLTKVHHMASRLVAASQPALQASRRRRPHLPAPRPSAACQPACHCTCLLPCLGAARQPGCALYRPRPPRPIMAETSEKKEKSHFSATGASSRLSCTGQVPAAREARGRRRTAAGESKMSCQACTALLAAAKSRQLAGRAGGASH